MRFSVRITVFYLGNKTNVNVCTLAPLHKNNNIFYVKYNYLHTFKTSFHLIAQRSSQVYLII